MRFIYSSPALEHGRGPFKAMTVASEIRVCFSGRFQVTFGKGWEICFVSRCGGPWGPWAAAQILVVLRARRFVYHRC
jgi:hypothetical protein